MITHNGAVARKINAQSWASDASIQAASTGEAPTDDEWELYYRERDGSS